LLAANSNRNVAVPDKLFPRRYYVDDEGQRVLVGLTLEQTREFESLEVPDPSSDIHRARLNQARWLELYLLHQAGWEIWRAERSETNLSRVAAG
jgi:hypothetical protein